MAMGHARRRMSLGLALLIGAACLGQQSGRFIKRFDKDKDGKLSRERFRPMFDRIDTGCPSFK